MAMPKEIDALDVVGNEAASLLRLARRHEARLAGELGAVRGLQREQRREPAELLADGLTALVVLDLAF
jgi:hypothetical protein